MTGPDTGRRRLVALKPRQVNLLLELCLLGALGSGLASWWLGDRWSGWAVLTHRVVGIALLVLAPAKMRGSVATGFRRRRLTRWLSVAFGSLVVATIGLGVVHATGLWSGVGFWSALWTHQLFAFALVPLFIWHLTTRPVRPRRTDLDRRFLMRGGLIAGAAVGAFGIQEILARAAGLSGPDRRFTGSHAVGSHDPAQMPSTVWINDHTPEVTGADGWPLHIAGEPVAIESLRQRATPVVATLDCTGGWYSEQSWDAVPLSELVTAPRGRSVRVGSRTGYDRLFAHHELSDVYLAVGYGGEPLRARHGAPVRLIAPGRRGPWWIKWVTTVEADDRPAWRQAPLPTS